MCGVGSTALVLYGAGKLRAEFGARVLAALAMCAARSKGSRCAPYDIALALVAQVHPDAWRRWA